MNFSVVKENIIEGGKRALKVFEFGAKTGDVVTAFGDDSSPIKDMIALYASTSETGDSVVIGYINKHQVSEPGEKRIFSLKENGDVSFSIHLKNNETCEIGGNTDNAVRYSVLETAFNELKSSFNAHITNYNAHQHAAPNGASPPTITSTASSADISGSKIEEINFP